MNIIVCMKVVIDPEAPLSTFKIGSDGKILPSPGIPPVLNPYDENSLEATLKIKESMPSKITVISAGQSVPKAVVKKSLAVGADELGYGRIINTTALAFLGMANHANYSAANARVVGLTRAVAKELFKFGITCNAYSPFAMTRASHEVVALLKEKAGTSEFTPLHTAAADRFMSFPAPESIAPLIIYLVSDAASQVSGSIFHIKGGNIGLYSEPEIKKTIDKANGWWSVEELLTRMPDLLQGYHSIALDG